MRGKVTKLFPTGNALSAFFLIFSTFQALQSGIEHRLSADGDIDDANVLLHRIEADNLLGLTINRADEKIRDAAYLEHACDVGILINIDTIEIHGSLIMMGEIAQDGLQALAGLAPVGIKVHNDRTFTLHGPLTGAPIGNDLLEHILINGMDGINSIHFPCKLLSIGNNSRQRQNEDKE